MVWPMGQMRRKHACECALSLFMAEDTEYKREKEREGGRINNIKGKNGGPGEQQPQKHERVVKMMNIKKCKLRHRVVCMHACAQHSCCLMFTRPIPFSFPGCFAYMSLDIKNV